MTIRMAKIPIRLQTISNKLLENLGLGETTLRLTIPDQHMLRLEVTCVFRRCSIGRRMISL